ncbi:TITAN-like protein isoform X2 [Ziziphus jujuba]|uniref:TITAN-like protein isoform X2 n=1 Tax=Ziziphus jujuba TaxID=326968 RepID=A0A6P3ZR77_ZIZJJ|nr:TITAN-like protein isoform X2 [Ziziphus jujuba]
MEEGRKSRTMENPNSETDTTTTTTTTTAAKKKKSNSSDKKRKRRSGFEFCEVCKLSHDQGHRHKYFPSHIKSLSTFLSRFHDNKISDIRFFLRNPSPLRSEHSSRNRFWCVFCETDIDELGSSFACSNAINHLASADHMKNLKHFLWKHGGKTDQVDNFTISEAEVAKWEKKCKSLEIEVVSSNKAASGPLVGPLNDIHNELNYGNVNSFENNNIDSVNLRISNGVMPLQYHTNEYQVSHSGFSKVANVSLFPEDVSSSLPVENYPGTNSKMLNGFTGNRTCQHSPMWNSGKCLADGYLSTYGVYQNERMVKGESSSQGLQSLTQITLAPERSGGNVHSGAPPPWFEAIGESQLNAQQKPVLSNKLGKSKKLNPKRVGAAWAERRKMEMEMEKRGELVKSECNANWLPNFGRVWQSGTRKESRKEFELEKKQKLLKVENQPEVPLKIQPYISKRMDKILLNLMIHL